MARKREQLQTPENVQTPCAHETCSSYAWVKIPTKTGWANLCMTHYEQHYGVLGYEAMKAHGLERMGDETHQEWRKRVIAYWSELARKAPMYQRMKDAA